MKLRKWAKSILQKNKKDTMLTEQQLISYQQNFAGQQFQWIKTDRLELKGKIVKVRDVRPDGIAVFDDGSKVNVKEINNKLMMIHGDMPPLTMDEVNAIHSPRKVDVIPETKLPNGEVIPEKKVADSTTSNVPPASFDTRTGQPLNNAEPTRPAIPVKNPFEMFNSDETEISIKVKIKMPDKKLLKMMYNNAENKDEFIDQLSNYVTSMINNNVVSGSITKMLDPNKATPKREETPEVNLTEIKNEDK
jgi:hypothetical protein